MVAISIRSICCIGAGYVGGPTMAVIAERCPEVLVTVVDINQNRIDAWNDNDLSKLPVYEPGLDTVVGRARGRNLFFSTAVDQAIAAADMVFISVNTPTKTKGLGAGQASDLRWVEACARQVAKSATGHTIVVEKSTLPVRTAEAVKAILSAAEHSTDGVQRSFAVLSNPEFLAEGTAIPDLESPDRVLIGGEHPEAIDALASIYAQWVPQERILRTNLWSSELSKLTANAFLAQRISSINSVAALCEATGADVREVAGAIGTDSRIGSKFLQAGPGFGGSCFQKDILNLVYLCHHFGLPDVAEYWESVVTLNTWQQHRIARTVVQKLFGTVTGKRLAILGFAFKADTNDTREAPAIRIAKDLLEEGAQLAIHDPKVDPDQIARDLKMMACTAPDAEPGSTRAALSGEGTWWPNHDIAMALRGADAVLILTEWDQYRELDWSALAPLMRQPAWVFDARSVVSPEEIQAAGLNLWRVGEGQP
ncbi:UDP-glucose 6-dehydrogenase [Synechococcus sp. MIT S9220]|uniref:nucleotide sugar dehydrogenase n=1 Tax=unclassified Synechococcus TaxID=2626047 RepID=UPI00164A6464|nr:nucleotide sugar dehydrogenase [Synechococcus sp. MIT S9220]NOL47998.1 nucleotide sugar dehydrogenase [Synechococcus sp. MIT S9220]QNJ21569.1 UDP-glucose 6-dehydrogenase [Synechococcus sp. MIT S9220]